MYLMIMNTGVAPVEAFTVLGVSTARGDASKIGQFGSGSKHGVNILLRNKINPTIFLGCEELKFHCKPSMMGEKNYNHVYYDFRGQSVPTGFALEFGAMDWDSVSMALREFISNAIDAVGVDNVVIDIAESPVAIDGATVIYVPLNDEIRKYYDSIRQNFLHFEGKAEVAVIEKNETNNGKIYRKGVFVREVSKPSMFDYNFDDSIKIDESRNMNDYACCTAAANVLGKNPEQLKKYIKSLSGHDKVWEDEFSCWSAGISAVGDAWKELHGDAVACRTDTMAQIVRTKGHKAVVINRNFDFVGNIVKSGDDMIGLVNKKNVSEVKPSATMRKTFDKIWLKLQNSGFTNNKQKPALMGFSQPMMGETTIEGFYDPSNQTCYINVEYAGVISTHLEEIAHYITGANDGDRAFQQFAFSIASRWGFRS